MEQGLIHIYCGDGKGKTSAAIGLAVRAVGSGLKVLFTRFLKNESSGELAILDDISQIKVLHLEKSYGFFKNLSEDKKQEVRETYLQLWRAIELEILTGRYDVLVIDELWRLIGMISSRRKKRSSSWRRNQKNWRLY